MSHRLFAQWKRGLSQKYSSIYVQVLCLVGQQQFYIYLVAASLYLLSFQENGYCLSTYFLTSLPTKPSNYIISLESHFKPIQKSLSFKDFLACRGGGAFSDTLISEQVNKSENLKPHRKNPTSPSPSFLVFLWNSSMLID